MKNLHDLRNLHAKEIQRFVLTSSHADLADFADIYL